MTPEEKVEQQLEELRAVKQIMNAFKDHPGYALFMDHLKTNIAGKEKELVASPTDLVHETARTYVAGEVNALTFVKDYADNFLRTVQGQIDVYVTAQKKHEPDNDED